MRSPRQDAFVFAVTTHWTLMVMEGALREFLRSADHKVCGMAGVLDSGALRQLSSRPQFMFSMKMT